MKNILQETFEKHINLVRKHFNLNESYNDPSDPSGRLRSLYGRFEGIPERTPSNYSESNEPSVHDVITNYNGPYQIMDNNEEDFINSITNHLSEYYPEIKRDYIKADVVDIVNSKNGLEFTSDDVIKEYMG